MNNEVLIFDIIGQDFMGAGVTAKDVKDQIDGMGDVEDITIRINSPGGDVFEGLAIFNILSEHDARITVKIDGYAASIASVIAMAGDSIIMASNSMMMIHNPFVLMGGDAIEFRKQADILDKVKDTLITTYQTKVSADAETLSLWMDDEKWLDASEAVELGFADMIVIDKTISGLHKKAANVSACQWIKNVPEVIDLVRPDGHHLDGIARSVELDVMREDVRSMRKELKA